MADYSAYKHLELPKSIEKYNIGIVNKNSMVIDSELHKLDLKNQSQDNLLATKESLNEHVNNKDNPHDVTKHQIGLNNVTNDKQVKGLNSGTAENNIVVFGRDGYSIKDSGFKIQNASVENVGLTQLEDSVTSTATDKAATPQSVKRTYDKVVMTEERLSSAINTAYLNSTTYTDAKITSLIDSAPETLDTLKELAEAITESKDVEEALNSAIGKKANQSELEIHTNNNIVHILDSERQLWNDSNGKKHIHENKQILDEISSDLINAWNNNTTQNHGHLNKKTIDKITQQMIDNLDGVTSNIQTQLNSKSASNHTHNYAGSSSPGGAATTALQCTGRSSTANGDSSGNVIISSYASSIVLSGQNLLLKSKSGATLTTLSLASLTGGIDYTTSEPSVLSNGMTWIGTAK